MSFFKLFFVGIIIGTAMIVPGVSGGVLAVVFNIYDKMIYSLTNLFKDFKRNFPFLFKLGLGIGAGAIWFSNIMIFLYQKHEAFTKFAFMGLILGGVPLLFKEIKDKTNKKASSKLIITAFLISIGMWFISKNILQIDLDDNLSNPIISFFNLFLAGIIYSIGKVIPGISGAFLLIMIGMYEYVLSVLSNPFLITLKDIFKLTPFVIGFIFGIIGLLKIINCLLKKHFRFIYSIIIGFVIGTIPVLIPKINSFSDILGGVIIMMLSLVLSYKLSKK